MHSTITSKNRAYPRLLRSYCVVVLNYHEVTEDSRVLKQVRALVSAGMRVHVYCNHIGEYPVYEELEGFVIHRFKCFGPENIDNSTIEKLAFLDEAVVHFKAPLKEYVAEAERYKKYQLDFENAFVGTDYRKLLKSYFFSSAGLRRRRLVTSYLLANLKLRVGGFFSPKSFQKYKLLRRMQRQDTVVRRRYRELYQASAVVLASNLMTQKFPDEISVVHAHDLFTLVAGTWLAERAGAKLIYDAHEYEIARATKMQPNGNSIALAIEDACIQNVHRLISVSPYISDLYAQRHPRLSIELVMNSPAAPSAEALRIEEAKSIRQLCKLDDNQPLLVFTGGVQGPHRGLNKVVEALATLPQFHLAILGQRIPKADRWLRSEAKSFGVWSRIHLFHEVDADLVPQTIASADIAICPIQDASLSYRFAMPNKLFEAAFADLPICVSNLPGLMSVVSDLKNGEPMDQTDPVDIARVVRHVYVNRQSYKLAEETRKILNEKYTWDVQMLRMLAMYKQLLV